MSDYLDDLAKRLQGVKPQDDTANLYFVTIEGACLLATTRYPIALALYEEALRAGKSCLLQDRRQGRVASFSPSTLEAYDDTGLDYYQQQKWGWTDEQMEKLKQEREASRAAAAEYKANELKRMSTPGAWLRFNGAMRNTEVFFYVRFVFASGALHGTEILRDTRNGKMKNNGLHTISAECLSDYREMYVETVRGLKLERFQ